MIKGITEHPETIPVGAVQRNITWKHDTAEADIVIGKYKGVKILSIISIINFESGNGAVNQLMKKIEGYAGQCRVDEIWVANVINKNWALKLAAHGYKPTMKLDPNFKSKVLIMVKKRQNRVKLEKKKQN